MKGELIIFRPSHDLRRLFQITGLDDYLNIRPKRAPQHGWSPAPGPCFAPPAFGWESRRVRGETPNLSPFIPRRALGI